jgi:hypothetical protein
MKIVDLLTPEQFNAIITIARSRGVVIDGYADEYIDEPLLYNFGVLGEDGYKECVKIAKEIGHSGDLRDF